MKSKNTIKISSANNLCYLPTWHRETDRLVDIGTVNGISYGRWNLNFRELKHKKLGGINKKTIF